MMVEIVLPTNFALDDLLNTLDGREQAGSDKFHTRGEWREILGLSEYKIKKLLYLALEKGVLLRSKMQREGLDGVWRPLQVYAFDTANIEGVEL